MYGSPRGTVSDDLTEQSHQSRIPLTYIKSDVSPGLSLNNLIEEHNKISGFTYAI